MTRTEHAIAAGDHIEINLDHPSIGCGLRAYTVVKVGRKWATLLYLPTLTTIEQDVMELWYNRSLRHVEPNPRTLRRLIKATLRERRELGLRSATAAAKAVLASLEGKRS